MTLSGGIITPVYGQLQLNYSGARCKGRMRRSWESCLGNMVLNWTEIDDYLVSSLNSSYNDRTVTEMVLLSLGMSLYTVLGVLGNGLVLLALYTQRKWSGLDSVMLIFIFNLTSCDFLICLITFPATAVSSAVNKWILGAGTCWVVAVCVTYLRITAILFMTMICIHRAVVLKYPFDEIINEKRGKIASLFIWIIASVPQAFPFFGYNPFHYDPIRAVCIADLHTDSGPSITTITAIVYVALPMFLITIIYSKILYIAISSRRKRSLLQNTCTTKGTTKNGSKAIITTLILVGSFILCFLPFLVITGVNQITNGISGELVVWGEFSSSFHCIINPLIYFYTNRTFRKFMLRPFKGTVIEKTKLFAKYNVSATKSQFLTISSCGSGGMKLSPNLSAPCRNTQLQSHYPGVYNKGYPSPGTPRRGGPSALTSVNENSSITMSTVMD